MIEIMVDVAAFLDADELEDLLEEEESTLFTLQEVLVLNLPLRRRAQIICETVLGPDAGPKRITQIYKDSCKNSSTEGNPVAAWLKHCDFVKKELRDIIDASF